MLPPDIIDQEEGGRSLDTVEGLTHQVIRLGQAPDEHLVRDADYLAGGAAATNIDKKTIHLLHLGEVIVQMAERYNIDAASFYAVRDGNKVRGEYTFNTVVSQDYHPQMLAGLRDPKNSIDITSTSTKLPGFTAYHLMKMVRSGELGPDDALVINIPDVHALKPMEYGQGSRWFESAFPYEVGPMLLIGMQFPQRNRQEQGNFCVLQMLRLKPRGDNRIFVPFTEMDILRLEKYLIPLHSSTIESGVRFFDLKNEALVPARIDIDTHMQARMIQHKFVHGELSETTMLEQLIQLGLEEIAQYEQAALKGQLSELQIQRAYLRVVPDMQDSLELMAGEDPILLEKTISYVSNIQTGMQEQLTQLVQEEKLSSRQFSALVRAKLLPPSADSSLNATVVTHLPTDTINISTPALSLRTVAVESGEAQTTTIQQLASYVRRIVRTVFQFREPPPTIIQRVDDVTQVTTQFSVEDLIQEYAALQARNRELEDTVRRQQQQIRELQGSETISDVQ